MTIHFARCWCIRILVPGLLLSTHLSLCGQTTSLTLSSGSAQLGGTGSLNLNFSVPAGSGLPAGLQWTLSYSPGNVASLSVAAGPALTASGKTLACNAITGSTTCLTSGMNSQTIGSGTAAVVTVTLTPTSSLSVPLSVTNTLGALVDGTVTPVTGTGGTISVPTNPSPSITSLSPASATAGGAAFTLTVNGSGFISSSVVNWNGSARTTTLVSASQLQAAISAADIAAAGTAPVTVSNPTPGGGTSGSSAFTINAANPVPTISTLSPASATAGGAAFTLTVNGTGFFNGSVVQWNGSSRTTTYVSANQLKAAILAVDIAISGTSQVSVLNPAPDGGTTGNSAFTINPSSAPAFTITKTHAGNFTQGQTGATYTITVTNSGTGPTNGSTVTVIDNVPAGMTVTGMSGTGWSCPSPPTCTRSDILAPATSYLPITLTVTVAGNAASQVTNQATVSGGGATNNNTASDLTVINSGGSPALSITSSHSGNFTQGQVGASYSIMVSNTGKAPTSGMVTVSDTVPAGLTATGMSGPGWTCNLSTASCTRSDALAAGGAYPTIILTVNVAASASPQVTNQVSASGGGAPLVSGIDLTVVNAKVSGWNINGGTWTTRKPVTVSHTQVSGTSTLSNFPMLVSAVDPDFRGTASGGLVGRSDGKDIFFTDANGIKFNHELVLYDGTAGKLIAWVQVPTISPAADTLLYVYFGNAQSGDQQNVTSTWDSAYQGVWHLGNGTTLSLADSTANAATLSNNSAQPTTGPVAGAVALGGTGPYLSVPINGTSLSQFTLEYWVYSAATPGGQEGQFQWAAPNTPIAGDPFLLMAQDPYNNLSMYFDGGYQASFNLTNSTWNHVAVTWNSSHVASLYVNGVQRGLYTSGANPTYQPQAQVLYFGTGYYLSYTGREAEARISNIARSADWVRTEYNNQNTPAAFYTLGASQSQ